MDPITAAVFTVAMAAVVLYALYWVVRKAVSAGIRDAAEDRSRADR